MKNKINRKFMAIVNYINDEPEEINFHAFLLWVFEYGYFNELFIYWNIIYDLICYHNSHLSEVRFLINDKKGV